MTKKDSTLEIKDGKVAFSQEILTYFENIRTEENSKWVDKYFKILSDESNLNAEKYNDHHVRPIFTFKDENHKNRKETKYLGDEFNGNLIKLSIYNHLFAHYYLWKIFDNGDSKTAFQRMCGQGKYIDNLTEDELKEIAKLKEDCAKKNQTEEERKERERNYNKSDKKKKVSKNFYERHKNEESYIKSQEKYYNSEKVKQRREELNKRRYFDPKTENYYSHKSIVWRLKQFSELYEGMSVSDFRCISKDDEEYKEWERNKKEKLIENKKKWKENYKIKNREKKNKQSRERHSKNKEHDLELKRALRGRPCYDPINGKPCTYGQLENRKRRHKEDYKNVIVKNCLI